MRASIARRKTKAACWTTTLLVLFGGACASNPSRIETNARVVSGDSRDTSGYVVYREITRDDFQASNPPTESGEHTARIGALLCGAIVADSEIVLDIEPDTDSKDTWFTIDGPDYRAKMDTACSWWNAEQATTPADYVLEHEQIHFALMEIYARGINQDLRELRIRTGSPEQAPKVADESATRLLERATRDLVEESRHFDDQTSRHVDREAQRRWKWNVERRLRDSN